MRYLSWSVGDMVVKRVWIRSMSESLSPTLGEIATLTSKISEICQTIKLSTDPLLPVTQEIAVSLRLELDSLADNAEAASLHIRKVQNTPSSANEYSSDLDTQELGRVYTFVLSTLQILEEDLQTWVKDLKQDTKAETAENSTKSSIPSLEGKLSVACQSLARARRASTSVFKKNWYRLLVHRVASSSNRSISAPHEGQLGLLEKSFVHYPFGEGLNSAQDAFIADPPANNRETLNIIDYSKSMEEMGHNWITGKAEALREEYEFLMELIWTGHLEMLRLLLIGLPNSSLGSPGSFIQILEQIDGGIRDAILRRRRTVYSIVFAGAINAGKSTLLNMLIGYELLPAATGPTTATPCRIQHVPGLEDPVLKFQLDDLNGALSEIREKRWIDIVKSMLSGEWKKSEPHRAQFFGDLKRRWSGIPSRPWIQALEKFSSPTFAFLSPVKGAPAIRQTLEDMNTLIRLCRLLLIGYERFSPSYWPSIAVEFLTLKGDTSYGTFELIDIPGSSRPSDPYQWNELTRQALRAADMIVCLISLVDFDTSPWRQLASKIQETTNVPVSAVIVTKTDLVYRQEFDYYYSAIRSIFWRDEESDRKILVCTPLFGPSVHALFEFMRSRSEKPSYEEMNQAQFRPGIEKVFSGGLADYERFSFNALLEDIEGVAEWTGYENTISAMKKMLSQDLDALSVKEAARGLSNRLKAVEHLIKELLVEAQKKHGTPTGTTQPDVRKQLVDGWNLKSTQFQTAVKALALEASKTIGEDTTQSVKGALKQAGEEIGVTYEEVKGKPSDSVTIVEFSSAAKLDAYLGICRNSLIESIREIESGKLSQLAQDIQRARDTHFSSFYQQIGEWDPILEGHLLPTSYPPAKNDLDLDFRDIATFSPEKSKVYSFMLAFKAVQEHILGIITADGDGARRPTELTLISRIVLKIAASIPFILGLPYWVHKSSTTLYTLQLSKLYNYLDGLVEDRLLRMIKRVEEHVIKEENQNNRLVSAFDTPGGQKGPAAEGTEAPRMDSSLRWTRLLVFAHANILAAIGACDAFAAMPEPGQQQQLGEPSQPSHSTTT
ncbi:hypothetical protein FRB91_008729 [Serendipita sp. 411]|nr:hypothetical protein FRB91_008729 [Serendipita sp. 411]